MKKQQGIIWAPVLIMVVVIVATGIFAYMLIKTGNTNKFENTNAVVVNQMNDNSNTISAVNVAIDPPGEWKIYNNTRYSTHQQGYSFQYPNDWTVNDFNPQYVRLSPPNQTTNEDTTPVTINFDYIVVPGEIPVQKIDSPVEVVIGGKTVTQGLQKGTPDIFLTLIPVEGGILQVSWVKNSSSDMVQKSIVSSLQFTD